MASKARQSVLGGLFEPSLNLVILPFFMRLRSSCGYDASDLAPHRVGDEEHSPIDQTDRVEAQLAGGVEIIKLDHIGSRNTFAAVWEPTLRWRPCGRLRTAQGRRGSLLLHRKGLAPSTSCRSPGA